MIDELPVIRQRACSEHLKLDRMRPPYRLPEGFQMLFYGDGRPITLINHYLANKAQAQIISGVDWRQTQQSLADDAAQATIFFHGLRKSWTDLDIRMVVQYAAALQAGYSVWTQKKLAKKTIHRRIGTVLQIAKFARLNGYQTGELPSGGTKPADILNSASGKLQELGHDLKVVAPTVTTHPRIRPILETKFILDELGRDIASVNDSEEECRDRLTAEVALYTGMRVDEVANLTLHQLLALASEMEAKPHQRDFQLWLTHTKGSKPGYVIFPKRIVTAILKYIETERAAAVQAARTRIGAGYREPGALFLNGANANLRDVGRPITAATISRNFSRAVMRCGMTIKEERFKLAPDGRLTFHDIIDQPLIELHCRAAHTYHDLRHTFAVVQYFIMLQRGVQNPLSRLRTLLRHTLTQTTSDIYLNWLDIFERQLSEKLANEYAELDSIHERSR